MENKTIRTTIYNDIFLIILGAMLISIAAQLPLSVPVLPTEVPGTWQTFVVLVFAFVMSRNVGILAVLLYLLAGTLGLPVFAESSSGIGVLFGKTGGYLFSFLIGAGIVGHFSKHKRWNQNFAQILLLMLLGTAAVLIFGTLVLGCFIGFKDGITYGLLPFMLGATIKIVLGAAFVWFAK